ncbi:tRNA lysidine(34) synthetase TilS [Lentilactobacillus parakefiri]|uniref:tRNA(Ile)-lysidine synthase n=1 Tax=Lentilactobacillus parakefiri TaxID=152332 RepID=A0A224VJI7_9LACO|nr:tRNA lysidine(34) synthetase TilS [Lentilactobacillus parakefiri]TDG88547.1 hypothetical protein C5L28_001869 [Lentilactobacillus parakefiri]GAW72430.1 tRNA(Ile)-lysidine synthetase [Lentilactobacillus parakefiri]
MDLQRQFNFIVKQKGWWKPGQPVVVAVSTGVDSMTLLHLLAHLPPAVRPTIVVAYVDHQLRDQSVDETHYITSYCSEHGLMLKQAIWPKDDHPETGIEAAARTFRYRFFENVLRETGSDCLLTAHHGDDLVETVIMKLVRGGQLASLTGIRETRPFSSAKIIRPLLPFGKQQLRSYAQVKGIKWFEDETNRQLSVERNRIRQGVMPLLKAENPQLLPHVLSYTNQLVDSLEAVHFLIKPLVHSAIDFTDGLRTKIDLDQLKGVPHSVVKCLLQEVLERQLHIPNVSTDQLSAVLDLIEQNRKSQGELDLEAGWQVRRVYQSLIICKEPQNFVGKPEKDRIFMVILDRWYSLDPFTQFGVFTTRKPAAHGQSTTFYLRDTDLPMQVRRIKAGDRLSIGHGQHQKVNRVLINAKVPNDQRKMTSVLVDARGTVLSVLGLKNAVVSSDYKDTKPYFLIEAQRK